MSFHLELGHCLMHWENRGLTRDDLARQVGCSTSAISHWINDRRPIRPDLAHETFRAFARAFDSDEELDRLARLAGSYQEKFPDRSVSEIEQLLSMQPNDAAAAPTSGKDQAHQEDWSASNARTAGQTKAVLAVAALVAALALSQNIREGAGFVAGQIWRAGTLDPIALFLWSLLFSSMVLFVLGFDGQGARKRARWIERGAWRNTYVTLVTGFLDRVDGALLPNSRAATTAKTSFTRNWSVELFEMALAVAVLYPIFLLMGQWVITGSDQTLGLFGGWPKDDVLLRRVTISGCFVGSVVVAFAASKQPRKGARIGLGCLAIAVNFAAYILCWISYGGVEVGPGAVNMATIAFILGIAFKLFDNIAVPAAAAATAGTVLGFAFLPLVEISELLVGRMGAGYQDMQVKAVHTVLNHSLNVALFFCLLWLFSQIVRRDLIRKNAMMGAALYTAVSVGTAGLMFFAATQRFWAEYYLFLGLIPILNAFFDFLSIGLTRYTLRLGLQRFGFRTLIFACLDIAIAVCLFATLVVTNFLLFEFLNSVTGSIIIPVHGHEEMCRAGGEFLAAAQLINAHGTAAAETGECVRPLLSQLIQDPLKHAWLIAVFASTLLPTALHLGFAVFAFAPALLGRSISSKVSRLIREAEDDLLARAGASIALGAWLSCSLVVIAVVLNQVLSMLYLSSGALNWLNEFLSQSLIGY